MPSSFGTMIHFANNCCLIRQLQQDFFVFSTSANDSELSSYAENEPHTTFDKIKQHTCTDNFEESSYSIHINNDNTHRAIFTSRHFRVHPKVEHILGLVIMLLGAATFSFDGITFDYSFFYGFNSFQVISCRGTSMIILIFIFDILFAFYNIKINNHNCNYNCNRKDSYSNKYKYNSNSNDHDAYPIVTVSKFDNYNEQQHVNAHEWYKATTISHMFKFSSREYIYWFIARCMGQDIGSCLFTFSMTKLDIGNAATILNSASIYTIFFQRCFFPNDTKLNKMQRRHYVSSLCVIIGTICIVQPPSLFNPILNLIGTNTDFNISNRSSAYDIEANESEIERIIGYIVAFSNSICWALTLQTMTKLAKLDKEQTDIIDDKSKISKDNNCKVITYHGSLQVKLLYTIGILYLVTGFLGSYIFEDTFMFDVKLKTNSNGFMVYNYSKALIWGCLNGLCVFIAIGLFNIALNIISPFEASLIATTEVLFSYILGLILFGQKPTWIQFVGAVIIIGTIVMLTIVQVNLHTKCCNH